jgi:hypothetical protein
LDSIFGTDVIVWLGIEEASDYDVGSPTSVVLFNSDASLRELTPGTESLDLLRAETRRGDIPNTKHKSMALCREQSAGLEKPL